MSAREAGGVQDHRACMTSSSASGSRRMDFIGSLLYNYSTILFYKDRNTLSSGAGAFSGKFSCRLQMSWRKWYNSIKYIEHVLDLFALEWHSSHVIRRFDIAYVAESHYGDQLEFYREDISENVICIRIMKIQGDNNPIEVCRCKITTE